IRCTVNLNNQEGAKVKIQHIRHTLRNWRYIAALLMLLLGVALLAKPPAHISPHGAVAGVTSAGPQSYAPSSANGAAPASVPAAQSDAQAIGQATVIHSVKNDISPPLWSIPPAPPSSTTKESPENPSLPSLLYPKP